MRRRDGDENQSDREENQQGAARRREKPVLETGTETVCDDARRVRIAPQCGSRLGRNQRRGGVHLYFPVQAGLRSRHQPHKTDRGYGQMAIWAGFRMSKRGNSRQKVALCENQLNMGHPTA